MSWVNGIDHIGIGVKDQEAMKSFYKNVLGFDKVFGEMPEEDHPPIHALLRTAPTVLSAVQLGHRAGGIAVALFHKTIPAPRAIRKDFRYGDIGLTKIAISVSDLEQTHRDLRKSVNFCSEPKSVAIPGWGEHRFVYCRDPEGNLIEFVSGTPIAGRFGLDRVAWIGIGVTDLERSKAFYREHLEFDVVVIENHETYSGLVDEISGSPGTRVRSCLLANSRSSGMIELFEVLDPRGRSMPFGAQWGDFGYLQVCLYGDDLHPMTTHCEKAGIDFLTPPQIIDDPEHPGAFMYISDSDGIPVEFVVFPQAQPGE
jgi:catechol 2,3-dioxygenase-like lactoylglutathione lyase family enzyme